VSSVSVWVRDIELTPEQHEALRQRNPAYNQLLSGRAVAAANRRRERLAAQEAGRQLAREPLRIAGCMLYWAEESKARNQLRFANSDPRMIRFLVGFLRRYFDLSDDAIRVICRLFADHVERQHELERFWLETVGSHSPRSVSRSSTSILGTASENAKTRFRMERAASSSREQSHAARVRRNPGIRRVRASRVARPSAVGYRITACASR
jgi:hypothetical protein